MHPDANVLTRAAPWLRAVVNILARGMPDATVVELDGGYACILESPDDFLAALTSHVASR